MRLGVARRKNRSTDLDLEERGGLLEGGTGGGGGQGQGQEDDDASQVSDDEAGQGVEGSMLQAMETWLRESLVLPLMSMVRWVDFSVVVVVAVLLWW